MGRKVHPYGFRLGYIYDWKARWYAEGEEYADLLVYAANFDLADELDYCGYFLTMWEIVRFCRERKILCQGRGSAANSAVFMCAS